MALFFPGKTTCSLCGKPIDSASEATAFPAFLKAGHRLASFSDAAFHTTCFEACPEREEVEATYKRFQQIWESRPHGPLSLADMEAWGKEAFRDFS
jgi:hypothetical protein